ncbi:unnamed protein product [Ectocarpus sp. CCAP 1310/34]|nr:unnamed protein product [Ectocarpus sp. CCAP 1310/34]
MVLEACPNRQEFCRIFFLSKNLWEGVVWSSGSADDDLSTNPMQSDVALR